MAPEEVVMARLHIPARLFGILSGGPIGENRHTLAATPCATGHAFRAPRRAQRLVDPLPIPDRASNVLVPLFAMAGSLKRISNRFLCLPNKCRGADLATLREWLR